MDVRDRSVIVTGASTGIGFETAKLLAGKGAKVLAVARSRDGLEELRREVPNITPFQADLTKADDRAAVAEALDRVDVLVNNAGRGFTGLVEEMSVDDVRGIIELNVLAMMELTQRVLPQML